MQLRIFSKEISGELGNIVQMLRNLPGDERATRKLLENASNCFKGARVLSNVWKRFEGNLVALDPIDREPLYSGRDSRNFFNIEDVMEKSKEYVSHSIWHSVPQVLTSIGIIGTFASILTTLSGSEKIDENFILVLVKSLATGFWSSLFGVGLSVVFMVYEKVQTRKINSKFSELNEWLEASFPSLTTEQILTDQQLILKNLSVEIGSSISRGFSEMTGSLGPALANVLDDETKKSIKEGIAGSFQELNAMLSEVRNESKLISSELNEIRASKVEMLENMKTLTSEQKRIQEDINVQSNNLAANLKEFEKTIAPLAEVGKQVQATNELSGRLLQSVESISTASAQMQLMLEKTERVSESAVAKFNEQISQISIEYSSLVKNIEGWAGQSNSMLQNNLAEFDKNIGSVLRQILALSNSFNTSVVGLERTVNSLADKSAGRNEKQ